MPNNNLYSLEVEQNALSGLLNNPSLLSKIDVFIRETDFYERVNSIIYSVCRQTLLKQEKLDKVLLADKINNLNIKNNNELSIFDYLDSLFFRKVNENGGLDSFKKVKSYSIKRELVDMADKMKKNVFDNPEMEISQLIGANDKIYFERIDSLKKITTQGCRDIFSEMEDKIEGIANNPPKEAAHMMGPFPTINRIYGSLSRPGNITVVGARSGVGKTSLGMFYNIFLANEYSVPILQLDNGEMSAEELIFRAACMLTGGKVPYWAIEEGKWRHNQIWTNLLRDVWPVVKRMKLYYEDVSDLSPLEIINLIRRYSYNVIGRNNQFIVNFDYLKPIEGGDRSLNEWQKMGFFIKDIKSFITNELPIPFWASLQLNKSGITTNKSSAELTDNEGAFSISDKIVQQASHGILVRAKTWDEIAYEGNAFGNLKAIFVKNRHLGRDYYDAINMVKVDKKTFKKNYINLNSDTFHFEDKGDLKQMVRDLKDQHNIQDGTTHHDPNSDANI